MVLARGWADNAPIDEGDDCFLVGEVNQQALFSRVPAVVHHGGAGTTTTAARAGTPQVIVPQIVDQPYWARRVAELGIGAAHDGPAPTFESLSAALGTALTPETQPRATAIAGIIRTDGAEIAAKLLLDAISAKCRQQPRETRGIGKSGGPMSCNSNPRPLRRPTSSAQRQRLFRAVDTDNHG